MYGLNNLKWSKQNFLSSHSYESEWRYLTLEYTHWERNVNVEAYFVEKTDLDETLNIR